LFDVNQGALDKSKAALEVTLSKLVEKEKITAETKAGIQSRTTYVTSLSDLSDADLVIEAIVENLEVKRKLFAELESIVAPTTILASNTSALSGFTFSIPHL
jgi:3-hydroxybutyryl-CoA dehydrogenase